MNERTSRNRARERAEELRRRAAALEPDADGRAELTRKTVGHVEAFLEALRDGPGWVPPTGSPRIEALDFDGEGRSIDQLLELVRTEVEGQGLNPASPRDLAWVPGGGVYASALGDLVAAVGNCFAGYYPSNPGAALLENRLAEWIAAVVGYPRETSGGTLTSGGSIGALTAVAAARDAKGLTAAVFRKTVVYATDQQHYSVRKAVHIAGLAEAVFRRIPVDAAYRMDAAALAAQVARDRREGLRPWLVITSAGTTNTGAIDPLASVSDISRREGLWHHVDAAYGGFFRLVPARRRLFDGIETSDSAVLDPHKSLFLPYGVGAVVLREAKHLDVFRFRAPYLVDAPQAEPSPSERSVELTRHFRAMRMFFPLFLYGVAPFVAALEEKWRLAQVLQAELDTWPEIETGPPPQLSTVCFRVRRPGLTPEETDRVNRELLGAFEASGRFFVTATILAGQFWLRPSIGVFRTHAEHIDEFLDRLRRVIRSS